MKVKKICNILLGIVGTYFVVTGLLQNDATLNTRFIFGIMWLLFVILSEEIDDIKIKLKEIKNEK